MCHLSFVKRAQIQRLAEASLHGRIDAEIGYPPQPSDRFGTDLIGQAAYRSYLAAYNRTPLTPQRPTGSVGSSLSIAFMGTWWAL